jgi:hypothetical protein
MSPWEACFYAGSPMTDLSQTDCKTLTAYITLALINQLKRDKVWPEGGLK